MNIFKNTLMEKISLFNLFVVKKKLRLISICEQVLKKDTFFIDYLITKKIKLPTKKNIKSSKKNSKNL